MFVCHFFACQKFVCQKFVCQKFVVPKNRDAKFSWCQIFVVPKNRDAKISRCRKIVVPKFRDAKNSYSQKIRTTQKNLGAKISWSENSWAKNSRLWIFWSKVGFITFLTFLTKFFLGFGFWHFRHNWLHFFKHKTCIFATQNYFLASPGILV